MHVRARRRDHEQVTRPREAVDPDVARHLPLGLLDVQVARADDHVDRVDGLGAVGERGDGLSATDRVDPGGARKPASGEHRRVHLAGGTGRSAHGHVGYPGDARGDHAHHDRARVRRPAAGHVDPGTPHRDLPQQHLVPVEVDDGELVSQPRTRNRADVVDRALEPGPDIRIQPLEGGIQVGGGDLDRRRLGAGRVKAPGVVLQRGVALGSDLADDLRHTVAHRRPRGDERSQLRRERDRIAVDRRQALTLHRVAPADDRSPRP